METYNALDNFLIESDEDKKKKKKKKVEDGTVVIHNNDGIIEQVNKTLITEDGRQLLI